MLEHPQVSERENIYSHFRYLGDYLDNISIDNTVNNR